jgi:hypothetical protein
LIQKISTLDDVSIVDNTSYFPIITGAIPNNAKISSDNLITQVINTFKNNSTNGDFPSLNVSGKTTTNDLLVKNNATINEINTSGVTTLNLIVQTLANVYDLHVTDVATILRTVVSDYISSSSFVPGLTGTGFKLYNDSGDWNLELDNLTVRKVMNVFELLINKIRSVNGGLVISQANGKIKSVTLIGNVYYLEIDGDMTFSDNDIFRCQVYGSSSKYYSSVVKSIVSGDTITADLSGFTSYLPEVGDELVQLGNTTDTTRQSAIYLSAISDGKPKISVLNGINSSDLSGDTKVVLGCLDDISDSDFSSISGYGLYAQNTYLKGTFVLHSGVTVENDATAKAKAALDASTGYTESNFVTTITHESDISNLQSQLDGSITSWFYPYIPTLYNSPASGWTTTDLLNQHLGDLFYNINAPSGSTSNSYRFALTGSTYEWMPITDTNVAVALANAAKAQDTADSKRRIFIVQPYTPYDEGDMWAQGSTGDTMRCIVSRQSGDYVSSDWDKASKYTDDMAAISAQDSANIAISGATIANNLLSDIANDNLLTASEKSSTLKEWNIIASEFSNNGTQADAYSVSRISYDASFYQLGAYLNNGNTYTGGTPSWLEDVSINQIIVGTDFRTNFKNYYDKRTDLLNSITTAAKNIATGYTNTAIANMQIGGTNLIPNGHAYNNSDYWFASGGSSTAGVISIVTDPIYGNAFAYGSAITVENFLNSLEFKVKPSTQYTFAITTKVSDYVTTEDVWLIGRKSSSVTYSYDYIRNVVSANASTGWQRFVLTFMTNSDEDHVYLRIDNNGSSTSGTMGYIYVTEVSMYTGSKDLGWSANVNDSVLTTVYSAGISGLTDQVILKASKTDLDALGQRVSTAESSIIETATGITSKVSKDSVISSINQTSESVTINASKINLVGAVTADSIATGAVTANKIAANAITTDKIATNVLSVGNISGLGSLASLSTISTSYITNLGSLATLSSIGLTNLDATIISNGKILTSLLIANDILTNALTSGTIVAGSATITNLTVDSGKFTNATVTGTLSAVSGTFSSLSPIHSGTAQGSMNFDSTYGMCFNDLDIGQQGQRNNRGLRFYSSDIRCRGMFGAHEKSLVYIEGYLATYYPNGYSTTDYVLVTLTATGTGAYYVPLYPGITSAGYDGTSYVGNPSVHGYALYTDLAGLPIDLVVINNTSTVYRYTLVGNVGKHVTVVNACDTKECYITTNGNTGWELNGGCASEWVNLYGLITPSRTNEGAGWLCTGVNDNNWA